MAKRKKVTIQESPFAKTERSAPAARPDRGQPTPTPAAATGGTDDARAQGEVTDKVRAVSVSLRESEYATYDQIAAGLDPAATRMAVMNEALRIFVRMYRAGKIKIASGIEGGRVIVRESK